MRRLCRGHLAHRHDVGQRSRRAGQSLRRAVREAGRRLSSRQCSRITESGGLWEIRSSRRHRPRAGHRRRGGAVVGAAARQAGRAVSAWRETRLSHALRKAREPQAEPAGSGRGDRLRDHGHESGRAADDRGGIRLRRIRPRRPSSSNGSSPWRGSSSRSGAASTPSRGSGPAPICRTCCPPSVPSPAAKACRANFGHHHLGFTLGPTSGRLLAEMMTGKDTFIDPRPYNRSGLSSRAETHSL